MGRLIDADVLMEYFKRLSDECSSENNYEYSNLYDCVCAEIMKQPTAYDVENVVAELEGLPIHYCEGHWGDYINQENVIDIVKRGGVDGKE